MQNSGDFIITWEGPVQTFFPFNSIYLKRYDKNGSIILTDQVIALDDINVSVGSPNVAINNDGYYVIAYHTNSSSLGRFVNIEFYDNDNNLISDPNIFDVNEGHYFPSVSISENGNFMVTANNFPTSNLPTEGSNDYEVIKQLYNSIGNPIGNRDTVNTTLVGAQTSPFIIMDSIGNSVVAWTENNGTDIGNIKARRYNNNGDPITGELLINTTLTGTQTINQLAMDDSGNYIIVWKSEGQDGNEGGIYAQYFKQDGTKIGSEFRVNNSTSGDQTGAAVSMNEA